MNNIINMALYYIYINNKELNNYERQTENIIILDNNVIPYFVSLYLLNEFFIFLHIKIVVYWYFVFNLFLEHDFPNIKS